MRAQPYNPWWDPWHCGEHGHMWIAESYSDTAGTWRVWRCLCCDELRYGGVVYGAGEATGRNP